MVFEFLSFRRQEYHHKTNPFLQVTYDLYIYQKRFIYKMKTICIQIENGLYTDRFLISQKSCFDLKKSIL
ncbi:hypothetical protein CLI72_05600 [Porphyromonas gingivalis]|nr:hypothetical protein CLI72_05600 [Porphyromonas gingivalis]